MSDIAVVLRFGHGNFEQDGFPVSFQVFRNKNLIVEELNYIRTPSAPELPRKYCEFQQRYRLLGTTRTIEPVEGQNPTRVGDEINDCCRVAKLVKSDFDDEWLRNQEFQSLRDSIVAEVRANEVVQTASIPVFIDADTRDPEQNVLISKLPWHLWSLFDRLPNSSPILSTGIRPEIQPLSYPVRILAIFGSSEGLELDADREAFSELEKYGAEIKLVIEPTSNELNNLLWDEHWDLICFSGHSSSNQACTEGTIRINRDHEIPIESLGEALKQAVENGLRVAIFNSCDGLGIATQLAEFNVPSMIVFKEPVPDVVARMFLKHFLQKFSGGESLYVAVKYARRRLQSQEADREYPCPKATWLPIVCASHTQSELVWPTLPVESPPVPPVEPPPVPRSTIAIGRKTLLLLATLGIFGLGLMILWNHHSGNDRRAMVPDPLITLPTLSPQEPEIQKRISLGKKVLIPKPEAPEKEAGAKAFAAGDYNSARDRFVKSLQDNPNDPEALIYSQNATIKAENRKTTRRIAVSVPAGNNSQIAEEILRGVAQAQRQINQQENPNGLGLEVLIANDDNDPMTAQEIADAFVKDSSILAVVGHNSSNVSIKASEIYHSKGLVMVTPTSTSTRLKPLGEYIFRTVPSDKLIANDLAQRIKGDKKRIAVCYDSGAASAISFRDTFDAAFESFGGTVVSIDCDLNALSFTASDIMAKANQKGVQGIVLVPDIDRLDRAIEVARANGGNLALFGSPTLYTSPKTLESGNMTNGLILSVPWFPVPGNQFVKQAQDLWKRETKSWRTYTSFNATVAIWQGLKSDPTRIGLQRKLSDPNFSADGADGAVMFRSGEPVNVRPDRVRVQLDPKNEKPHFVKEESSILP